MCWLPVFVTLMVTTNAFLYCLQHLQTLSCMLCSVCVFVHACVPCLNWMSSELTFILGPTVTLQNWKRHRHVTSSSYLRWIFFFQSLLRNLSFILRQCGCTYVSERNSSLLMLRCRSYITFQFFWKVHFFVGIGTSSLNLACHFPKFHIENMPSQTSLLEGKSSLRCWWLLKGETLMLLVQQDHYHDVLVPVRCRTVLVRETS